MTEEDARAWMVAHFGDYVVDRVAEFVAMVVAENERQNLISPASIGEIWARHVVDSAQLVALAPPAAQTWIDIGTGGGFPGVVVALCWSGTVTMIEPRRRRAEFLQQRVETLGLAGRTAIHARKIETITEHADVISARAVASVEKLLQAARQCATPSTRWILPRGRSSADDDLPAGEAMFHVEHSITDPASRILLIDGMG